MKLALALLAASLVAVMPAHAEKTVKIAIVDTGNTGRSVTAEALMAAEIQKRGANALLISRAVDMDPFEPAPEANFVTLLKERGIDVSAHRAAQLTTNDVKHADLILVMTAKHKAAVIALMPDAASKTFMLSEYVKGESKDVADAYGQPMPFYQETLKQIDAYIAPALDKALKPSGG